MRSVVIALLCSVVLAAGADRWRFSFGGGNAADGFIAVTPATGYTAERGYGFDLGSSPNSTDRDVGAFYFSVALPEGNYNVTLTLGDVASESVTTVKSESRRLALENVRTTPGKRETRTFTVNVRTPRITGDTSVRLKERERGVPHWDDKLTLEFSGARPRVSALEIVPATNAITVFLAGDSTVTDQPREPYAGWGQMLPRFFKPGVAVANHAESGESLKSFLSARRLEKILHTMKPGDYLFIQFGHNDQKEKGEGVGAFTTYKARLQQFVGEARKRGGLPVLVTSMNRRSFDGEGKIRNSLGDFPEAVRQVAKEESLPLIDLHAMSKPFYEALEAAGKDASKKAFAPGDNTHHNNYGGYELAKCVVEGIRKTHLGLERFLVDGLPSFDPAHPDALESFVVPPSPQQAERKPDGN